MLWNFATRRRPPPRKRTPRRRQDLRSCGGARITIRTKAGDPRIGRPGCELRWLGHLMTGRSWRVCNRVEAGLKTLVPPHVLVAGPERFAMLPEDLNDRKDGLN